MLKYCHFVRLEVIQGLWRIVLDELNEQDLKNSFKSGWSAGSCVSLQQVTS